MMCARGFKRLGGMLCVLAALGVSVTAQAKGSLKAGETVAAIWIGNTGHLIRLVPGIEAFPERISGASGYRIVVKDRNTVLILTSNCDEEILEQFDLCIELPQVISVDVRSGAYAVIQEYPAGVDVKDIALLPNGEFLALVDETGQGSILREDGSVLVSSPELDGAWDLAVNAAGDVFVQECITSLPSWTIPADPPKTLRLSAGSSEIEVIYQAATPCSPLMIDPSTGHPVVIGPAFVSIEETNWNQEQKDSWRAQYEYLGPDYRDSYDRLGLISISPVEEPFPTTTLFVPDRFPREEHLARLLLLQNPLYFFFNQSSALTGSDYQDGVEHVRGSINGMGDIYIGSQGVIRKSDDASNTLVNLYGQVGGVQDLAYVMPECLNGLDDDGDGFVDLADAHCFGNPDRNSEVTGCSDGRDNDLDGLTDLDDIEDCPDHLSDGEIPDCANGIDDDSFGGADRFDVKCIDGYDRSEYPECSDGLDNNDNDATDLEDLDYCPESVHNCENASCPERRSACSDGWDNDGDGYTDCVDKDFDNECDPGTEPDPECANSNTLSELPACDDGLDNDGDGLFDTDPDGEGPAQGDPDCDEFTGTGELSECQDGIDNNGDGLTDWPYDPGCISRIDDEELAPCQDLIDNDGDGFVDLEDEECTSELDHAEGVAQCSNGEDDDDDGFADYDGIDEDGDGELDVQPDPNCRHDGDNTEVVRQCSDGNDNDGDTLTDFPADTYCTSFEDNKEAPGGARMCSASLADATLPGSWLLILATLLWWQRRRQASLVPQAKPSLPPACLISLLCLGTLLGAASTASAKGSLRVGDLIAVIDTQTGTHLVRLKPGLEDFPERIATLDLTPDQQDPRVRRILIKDRNTVLVLQDACLYFEGNCVDYEQLYSVDVRSGAITFVQDYPEYNSTSEVRDIALLPNGQLLALVNVNTVTHNGQTEEINGTLVLQDGTVLLSSPELAGAQELAVNAAGDIFVQGCIGPLPHAVSFDYPLEPPKTTYIPAETTDMQVIYEGGMPCSPLMIDPSTGHPVVIGAAPTSAPIDSGEFTAYEQDQWRAAWDYLGPEYRDNYDLLGFIRIDPSSEPAQTTQWFVPNQQVEDVWDSMLARMCLLDAPYFFFYVFEPRLTGWGYPDFVRGTISDSGNVYLGSLGWIRVSDRSTNDLSKIYGQVAPDGVQDLAFVLPECMNGLDDDGDGDVDLDDPHCFEDPNRDSEVTGCSDGKDNDLDGDIDLADSDCMGDEFSDGEIPDCANGIDDDSFGGADRFDVKCIDGYDRSEYPECSDGLDNNDNDATDLEDLDYCPESVHNCENASCPERRSACSDGWDNDGDGYTDCVDKDFDNECDPGTEPDPECANSNTLSELPACDDGLDNDGDGLFDTDPDGEGPAQGDPDCDEFTGTGELSECQDGIDNNGDGLTDWPYDPGCISRIDDEELAPCQDLIDNDGDGFVDLEDEECTSELDHAEGVAQCSNGEDDDDDGFADYDGIDEDGDGELDVQPDPNCRHDGDNTEVVRQCSDGNDNDGDTLTDFPADTYCTSFEDNKEAPGGARMCSASLADATLPGSWLLVLAALIWWQRRRSRLNYAHCTVGLAAFALASVFPTPSVAQSAGGGEGSGQFTALSTAPEANFFSGSVSTSVPIQLPQGRPNATPQLQLGYSSGGGSGPFGYGWDLPLGSVERNTKYGRPRCTGDYMREFVLMLSGGSMELVKDGSVDLATPHLFLYRPKVDESYLEAILDETELWEMSGTFNSWTVRDRAGMTYRFGDTSGTRVFHNLDEVIREDLPLSQCEFTSIWGLTEMKDPNGNTVDITYFKHENTLYPDEIAYGGNPSAGLSEHPFKVRFVGANPANGPVSERAFPIEQSNRGIRERLEYIINRIEVYYKKERGAAYELMRAYDLTYTASPDNGRMLLTAVDDDPAIAGDLIPQQTFTYSTSEWNHNTASSVNGSIGTDLGYSFSDNGTTWTCRALMDVNGDGLSDYVSVPGGKHCESTAWTVHRGTTDGFSGAITLSHAGPIRRTIDNGGNEGNATARWVVHDTLDVTGDGIVDFVDASSAPWTVRPGSCTSPTSCTFGGAMSWDSPEAYVEYSSKSGSEWTTHHRLIDVSGDGRPDLVKNSDVYLNTGSGFEFAVDATLNVQTTSTSNTDGSSTVQYDVFDFNGDGLPDRLQQVPGGKIYLYLNSGRVLGTWIPLFPAGTNYVRASDSNGETYADFFDINADGLPDRVRRSGNAWYAQLNEGGAGLSEERLWHASLGPIRREHTYVDIEDDGEGAETYSWKKVDLMDINGDGLLDRVDASTNPWTVHLGKPATGDLKPLLLVKAENGIGGVTELDYTPSAMFSHTSAGPDGAHDLPFSNWVVTEIRNRDGLGTEAVQTIEYEGGLFDTVTRDFRGFRTVTVTDQDGNQHFIEYGQGYYDRGKTLVSEQYVGLIGSGQLLSRETFVWQTQHLDAESHRDQIYLAERRTEELDVSGHGYDRCVLNRNEPPDLYGRVGHACSLSCDGAPLTPGSCASPIVGQVDTETVWGDPMLYSSVRERPLQVTTSYVAEGGIPTLLAEKLFFYDGGGPLYGFLGIPHDDGVDCGLYGDEPCGEVSQGNVKRVATRFEEGEGLSHFASVWNQYDGYGNVVGVVTPEGKVNPEFANPEAQRSHSSYDSNLFSLYPVTETNPMGHAVHRVTDLRYGKPVQVTGANGEVVEMGYDGIGRTLCEAKSGQSLPRPASDPAGCDLGAPQTYDKQYSYHRGDPAGASFEDKLSYAEVHVLEPHAANGYLVSRQYIDGLQKKRLTIAERLVGESTELSTVVVEHVSYDGAGRVSAKHVPYELTGSIVPSPSSAATSYSYGLNGGGQVDPRGRVHRMTGPDGKQTLSYHEGRRSRVVTALEAPHENEARTIEDDFGRVTRKESYEGLGGEGSPPIFFENTYDGMGRVLTEVVSGHQNTLVTHTYDLSGREVMLYDPDAGTWESQYDKNGNLIYRDDPKPGQHVQWLYDDLNRLTRVCVFSDGDTYVPLTTDCGAGVEESRYVYDETAGGNKGIGQLTSVTDQSGSVASMYDGRGRVTKQTRTVLGISATTSVVFDGQDRIESVTYPDGEVVEYTYKKDGLLNSFGSSDRTYYSAIDYDLFNRPERIVHGNGVTDTRSFYGPEESFRLAGIQSTKGASSYLNLGYEYNSLSKLENLIDHRNASGNLSNSATYTYDAFGRLITWDRFSDGNAEDTYAYDPIGNLIEKGGHILQYAGAPPHQVTQWGSRTYEYDESGRRTHKEDGDEGQTYTYDALDRLTQIDFDNGDTVDYVYDYTGQRAAKRTNGGSWVRFYSDAFESEIDDAGDGWVTKYYFAGERRIANFRYENDDFVDVAFVTPDPWQMPDWLWILLALSAAGLLFGPGRRDIRLGVAIGPARASGAVLLVLFVSSPALLSAGCRPPSAGPHDDGTKHYHFDHLGSTQAVTDGKGKLVQQVRYEPYGEIRGRFTAQGVLLSGESNYRHEFTGYETEFESGLMYAGARYFDPETGQFLSHDPEEQFASPYAYGPGDPVNHIDPDGRFAFVALVVGALIAGAVAAAISFTVAIAMGATFSQALKGAAQAFAISFVAYIIPPLAEIGVAAVLGETAGAIAKVSLEAAYDGYQQYQKVRGAIDGDPLAALSLAIDVVNFAKGVGGAVKQYQEGPSGRDLAMSLHDANGAKEAGTDLRGKVDRAQQKVEAQEETIRQLQEEITRIDATAQGIRDYLAPPKGALNITISAAKGAVEAYVVSRAGLPMDSTESMYHALSMLAKEREQFVGRVTAAEARLGQLRANRDVLKSQLGKRRYGSDIR